MGSYPTAASIGLPPQSIASLKLGGGITVTLCAGEFYGPPCSAFTTDETNLSSVLSGGQVSSMLISDTLPMTNVTWLPIVDLNYTIP
jgi:hypothetical protein